MIGFDEDFNLNNFIESLKKNKSRILSYRYFPISSETQNEMLKLSKQILQENEQLKRQLLVEQTIAECMAKLRRKGK